MHGLSAHPMGGDGWKSYSGIQCIHEYPRTVRAPHGGRWLEKLLWNTMYPWISTDCPRTPWGEMAGKVTLEYNVSMDMHGLSAHPMGGDGWKSYSGIQCIHEYPRTVRAPHGGRWLEKLLWNTMYPWISTDCPRTPWGEMAGKVTREYNVSMDMHGLSAHPMGGDGWKSYSGIQCIHGYAWTVCAPHGGRWLGKLLGNTMYPWISTDCPRTPLGGDGWKSYSGIQCIHAHREGRWLEKLLGNTMDRPSTHGVRDGWKSYSAPKLDMELMVFLPFLCV